MKRAASISRALLVMLMAGLACLLNAATPPPPALSVDIGLASDGTRIDALVVEATVPDARTVVLIGGLQGKPSAAGAAAETYARERMRPFRLLAVPEANPAGAQLAFPPQGTAYRENVESHTLWRWLGAQAPDLVLIEDANDGGLAEALRSVSVADMGTIPARSWTATPMWHRLGNIPRSPAREEFERRLRRSPRELATLLARHYGRDFEQPWYIGALALVARIELGETRAVQQLVEQWVDGTRDSLARPNALVMSGHVVFTDLARRTGDARYLAMVRKVADMGFDGEGRPLEAMPYHDGYSDSVFMGTTILAQAGTLTGEQHYLEMADRHLRFMERLDLRPDGLYRHRPEADVAWGRGNGFAALGLALTLSELPTGSAQTHALQSYRELMATLLPLQNPDGLWRNVVNHPGAFPEFSATAMIGFALQRGLSRGWIRGPAYEKAVAAAWRAVNARTSADGGFIDVCESTARLTTLQEYLTRAAILGRDDRGGAMAMLFAVELMR